MSRIYSFIADDVGDYEITTIAAVTGTSLPDASRLRIEDGYAAAKDAKWCLRGATSYQRYVNASEQRALEAVQPPLGRPEANRAALIPIKKSAEWWRLPHDVRRQIFEERSRHIATGLKYLPAIARRLHHSYELDEPFDFLTWFEYAESDGETFEDLVRILRATEEWKYVEREVDVRLVRVTHLKKARTAS